METIEKEIENEDFDGLRNREARKRLAREKFFEGREAAELRELATVVAVRKIEEEEERERERARLQAAALEGSREKTAREVFIEEELAHVRQVVPHECLRSCVMDMVQVDVEITKFRRISLKMVFPEMYPQDPINIDARSQTLSPELLAKIHGAAGKEALKHVSGQQVLPVFNLVNSILETNRLAPAYDDMKQIQALLANTDSCIKSSKEKMGTIHVCLRDGQYYLDLKFTIPDAYPDRGVEIELKDGNLPAGVQNTMMIQAQESAHRLAEPPKVAQVSGDSVGRDGAGMGKGSKSEKLTQNQTMASRKMTGNLQESAAEAQRKAVKLQKQLEDSHIAKPSLYPVIQYLFEDGLRLLSNGKCLICDKRLIPGDPSKVNKIPKDMVAFQLYCSHMYHFKCLEDYISTPPFGKACLVCGKKIQHAKLVTDVKVLEQRWMHKQAREREIADVADFLSF